MNLKWCNLNMGKSAISIIGSIKNWQRPRGNFKINAAYVDLADPAQPLVTPNVQEGVYIPVSLHAKYQVNSLENEGFFGVYRLGGRYYQDKELSNANEYLQELGFGSEYRRREENRERRVYSAFKIAQHEEITIPADTIDNVLGELGVARIDHLNLTVNRSEFEALHCETTEGPS